MHAKNTILASLVILVLFGTAFAGNPFGAGRLLGMWNEAEDMGLNYVRYDLFWAEIQSEQGEWRWDTMDRRILEYESRNLKLLPNILCGQCWANGYPGSTDQFPSYPPEDLEREWNDDYGHSQAYYTFIYKFVTRYIDNIDRIAIENEVSVPQFWGTDERDYLRLLKTAYKAAHDANPDIWVYDSGLPSYLWGVCLINDMILEGQYRPNQILVFANRFFHRIGQSFPDYDTLVDWINQRQEKIDFMQFLLYTMQDHVDGLNIHFAEDYWFLPRIFEWIDTRGPEYGIHYKKFISNEITQRDIPPNGWPVEERTYALDLYKRMITGLSLNIKELLYYPFSEKYLLHEKYGLLDDNDQWREAAYTFQWLMSKMGDEYKFQRKFERPSLGAVQTYLFASKIDSSALYFLWWDDGLHGFGSERIRVTMDEDVDQVKQYDYLGNETILYKPRPQEFFLITEEPVCLEAYKPFFHFEVVKN